MFCVLSRNEIQEIVMYSDSDEDKHYVSQESEDEEEPAHLRDGLPFHGLLVQIILPAALKMRLLLVMWQINSNNPLCGHCPLNPKGV